MILYLLLFCYILFRTFNKRAKYNLWWNFEANTFLKHPENRNNQNEILFQTVLSYFEKSQRNNLEKTTLMLMECNTRRTTKKNFKYLNLLLKLWMTNSGVDLLGQWFPFTFIKKHFKMPAFIKHLSEAQSLKRLALKN